jgi:serine/threonine protein kinase
MSVDRELLSRVLPAYDIGAELGAGGWGIVVAGQHRQLHRQVAIKQLPSELSADPAVRRRFTAEARVLASLDHPHVVPVYDFVERDGVCLLVMELLPGGTLRSRASDGAGLTAPRAVALALACASGLSAAHRRGILHRDVKPDNMLFAASGVLKVTDFGIAKVIGGADTVMTRAGDVLGTPAYIAPEQVLGAELSPATDVYGLATMLYQLLAGVFPFSHDGPAVALLFKHAHEAPTPLRDVAPHVPEAVAAVVMRGLATDPAQRFQTAESFGAALAQAGTKAWHAGWLWAEQVPILDAEPIVNAAGYPSAPRSAVAPPTIAPGLLTREEAPDTLPSGAAGRNDERADTQASPGPAQSSPGPAQSSLPAPSARDSAAPAPRDSAAPAARDSAAPEPHDSAAGRRRIVVAAVVVAVIVIAIIAILVLPGLFKVYRS